MEIIRKLRPKMKSPSNMMNYLDNLIGSFLNNDRDSVEDALAAIFITLEYLEVGRIALNHELIEIYKYFNTVEMLLFQINFLELLKLAIDTPKNGNTILILLEKILTVGTRVRDFRDFNTSIDTLISTDQNDYKNALGIAVTCTMNNIKTRLLELDILFPEHKFDYDAGYNPYLHSYYVDVDSVEPLVTVAKRSFCELPTEESLSQRYETLRFDLLNKPETNFDSVYSLTIKKFGILQILKCKSKNKLFDVNISASNKTGAIIPPICIGLLP